MHKGSIDISDRWLFLTFFFLSYAPFVDFFPKYFFFPIRAHLLYFD